MGGRATRPARRLEMFPDMAKDAAFLSCAPARALAIHHVAGVSTRESRFGYGCAITESRLFWRRGIGLYIAASHIWQIPSRNGRGCETASGAIS